MRGRWRVERVRLRKSVKVERIEERLGFKENVMTEVETGRRSGAFNTMLCINNNVFLFVKFPFAG